MVVFGTRGVMLAALVGVTGCANRTTKIEFRLVEQGACHEGEMPGQGFRIPCTPSAAEWVVIDMRENGLPYRDNRSVSATLELPDGRHYAMPGLISYSERPKALFFVPKGYEGAPVKSTIVFRSLGHPEAVLARVPLGPLPSSAKAIAEGEPRMKVPQWKVRQLSTWELEVTVLKKAPGTLAQLSIIRTTHVNWKTARDRWRATLPVDPKENLIKVPLMDSDPNEVEIAETDLKPVTMIERVPIDGVNIEKVFGMPVISVKKPIIVRTDKGTEVEIPVQRKAPFRAGNGSSRRVTFRVNLRTRLPAVEGFGNYQHIDALDCHLGERGVSSIKLEDQNSGGPVGIYFSYRDIRLTANPDVHPGPAPMVLTVRTVSYRVVGKYRGIVSVSKG